MEKFLTLEWSHSCVSGMTIQTARRFTEEEKPKYAEWYRDSGFVSLGDRLELEFKVPWDDAYVDCLCKRDADGSFNGSGNTVWIISEDEMKEILVRNEAFKEAKRCKEIEEKIQGLRRIVNACESQMATNRLYSEEEAALLHKRYNDIHNEGGEGYVPKFWTIGEYERAVAALREMEGELEKRHPGLEATIAGAEEKASTAGNGLTGKIGTERDLLV